MLKKFLKILAFILFSCILVGSWIFLHTYGFKIKNDNQINTDPQYARIYYDFASIPTLYMAYDWALQQPEATSFVLFDRIPNLDKNIKSTPNTQTMKHIEHNDFLVDNKILIDYYKAHPNTQFIIHSNNMWVKNIFPIIRALPSKAIKEIHLYEDGSYSTTYKMHPRQEEEFKNYRKHALKKYKIIYHMEDANLLNSPRCLIKKRCLEMKKEYKNDIVAQNSLQKIQKHLEQNSTLKNKYFSIFNFDYKKYQTMMKHPFGIYTFSLYRNDKFAKEQLNFMNELLYGNLSFLVDKKNVKWFYKEHPAIKAKKNFASILSKQNPEMTRIEKHLPMELLIIAGITPDYIAGYSSSIYMTVPKNSISAFIRREPKDPYLYLIYRDNLIRPGRIFYIGDTDESLKAKYHRFISRILTFFQ